MPNKSAAGYFTEYRKRLFDFIRRQVRRIEDAEDILQDVFYSFYRVNALASPVENIAAWLYRAARNKIIDHYRKKKDLSVPARYDGDEDNIFEEIADILYGEEQTPETKCLRSLIFAEIQNALGELPKEQREAFELSEIHAASVKEIAEKTKTPLNTVLSRKHYAVKFLRRRLSELYRGVRGKFGH